MPLPADDPDDGIWRVPIVELGDPEVRVTWRTGHPPAISGQEADWPAAERQLRDFAHRLRAAGELDDIGVREVRLGPPGPDEAPFIVGMVDISLGQPPRIIMDLLIGHRRSEMADLAAQVLRDYRLLLGGRLRQ